MQLFERPRRRRLAKASRNHALSSFLTVHNVSGAILLYPGAWASSTRCLGSQGSARALAVPLKCMVTGMPSSLRRALKSRRSGPATTALRFLDLVAYAFRPDFLEIFLVLRARTNTDSS